MSRQTPLRIALVSDTHNLLRPELLSFVDGSDAIVHAGDICEPGVLETLARIAPLTAVRGNNDRGAWAEALPVQTRLEIGGIAIAVVHELPDLRGDPRADGVAIVVSGHSHKPALDTRDGDTIDIELPMTVRRLSSHSKLRHAAGKVAVQRGPIVYCLEEADNGADLHDLHLPRDAAFDVVDGASIDASLAGKVVLQADGYRSPRSESDDALYAFDADVRERVPQRLIFIPYFCWANRGEGEMRVWVNEG